MSMTDPIADLLARIRNAIMAGHEKLDLPSSKIKVEIARVLKDEGFIRNYKFMSDRKQGTLRISLKNPEKGQSAIVGIKRISKPGRRVYVSSTELPRVLNGLGIAIISTNLGILTDRQCHAKKVGGEVLCYLW